MKSIVLMFFGGLIGGLIGPMTALAGVATGDLIGRALTHSVAPDSGDKQSPCR